MHEHILIFDKNSGKGIDVDILDDRIVIDELTSEDIAF